MDIMIGIEDSAKEMDIQKLAEAGATEYFCGIIPPDWASTYNYQISLNKREWKPNQFHSFEKLAATARKIHSLKRKIAVTFNAHYYTAAQVPLIEKYLFNLKEIGVDALIIGNMPILLLTKSLGIKIPVYISGELGVYNRQALKFFKKYNVKRILFPRDVSTAEMSRVIQSGAGLGLEYEAFAMSERCVFSAGYCRTSHGYSQSNFCNQQWNKSLYMRLPLDFSEQVASDKEKSAMELIPRPTLKLMKDWNANSALYRSFTNCSSYPTSTSAFSFWGGCGLCAVSKLREIGITSLKIVSRGTSLKSKLMRLNVMRQVLQSEKEDKEFIKKLKNTREICDIGYDCYYREMRGKNG